MQTIKILSLLLSFNFLVFSNTASAQDPWTESYRLEALAQYEAAIKALDPVLNKAPKNELAILRTAWLNYLKGSHNDAIKYYKNAQSINPQSLDAMLGEILPLLAQQRWNEAAQSATKVLKVAPWNYYAHVRLMIAEEGQRRWKTLASHASEVHARYPSDATVLVYQARAQRWLNDTKAATATYYKVLQLIPGHIEAVQFIEGGH